MSIALPRAGREIRTAAVIAAAVAVGTAAHLTLPHDLPGALAGLHGCRLPFLILAALVAVSRTTTA